LNTSISHLRAIGFALIGFTFWVFADTCMKLAGEASLPPYEVVAFLGFFAALLMMAKTKIQGKTLKFLWPRKPRAQLGSALLSLGTNAANVIALKHLSLALFYAAVFTEPMLIALLASFLLHEHLNWKKGIATVAGFAGVIIAINPWANLGSSDWIGYAAVLASTIFFTANTLWLRVMTQTESADSLAFFSSLVGAVCCGVLMLWHTQPVDLYNLFILFVMAFLAVIGSLCCFIALRLTAAATVEQFHYTQIVTGAILGYIIWHDIPAFHTILGAAIIIGSGLYIAAHAHKTENIAAIGIH
jgi:drug/metabolite transporter (DMT)-like permease